VPLLARLGPLARTFDFVATAAPGVKEILTVGKLTWEVRENHYDLVVVDASATGHVVGQLASPVAMADLVKVGLVRQQTEWMIEMLTDPATTGVVVVTTPEEMPVSETLELMDRLDSETDIDVAAVVANRVLPELFTHDEEALFDRIDTPEGREALEGVLGRGAGPVVDASHTAMMLRRSRAVHLSRLRSELPPELPVYYVPYLFTRSHGIRTTRQVADFLAEELL
jgi:anion-transporting  ArsA/GET3 family ATPase